MSKKVDIDLRQELTPILEKLLTDEAGVGLLREIQNETNNLDLILKMCKVVQNKLQIQQTMNAKNNAFSYSIGNSVNNQNDYLVYGAKLIFLIRATLTGKYIDFYFNGAGSAALVSGKDVIDNFIIRKRGEAVGLSTALEKALVKKSDKKMDTNLYNHWSNLSEMAKVQDIYKKGTNVGDIIKKGHNTYQKTYAPDNNVFALFDGGTDHKIATYYLVDGEYKYFNMGWLWEWFLEKHLKNKKMAINQTSLAYLFKDTKIDNIRGTQQGDIRKRGQDIQAKNYNETIITTNSILEILYNLVQVLTEYKAALQNGHGVTEAKNNIKEKLREYFIPQEIKTANAMAQKATQIVLSEIKTKT